MPEVVGIRFKNFGKIYNFAPNGIVFEVGDGAIVETVRGTEYGRIVISNREIPAEEVIGQLKPVIRKALPEDTERHLNNLEKKSAAMTVCREKIAKHNLAMKLIDVEYTFDNSKLIFYFSAEGRIDFRELAKDLASIFRIRIELRQIGIRDVTKIMGGLGACGRPCCCSVHLGDFERVSIKMAKTQRLSLNPVKISGLCGRLMCCLKYENDHYIETSRCMPQINSIVKTPEGEAEVENVDLIRRKVTIRKRKRDGGLDYKVYNLSEIEAKVTLASEIDSDGDDDDLGQLND